MTRTTVIKVRRCSTIPVTLGFVCLACLCTLWQPPVAAQDTPQSSQEPAVSQKPAKDLLQFAQEIAEALRLYNEGKTGEAERAYDGLLRKATEGADDRGLAEAHLGLCAVAYRYGKYEAAHAECERALPLFNSLRDSGGLARVEQYFGNIVWQGGDNKAAREHYNEALKGFETAGMLREKAVLLLSLAYATDGYPERTKLDNQALDLARQLGDRRIQAQALHGIGQWLFVQGDARGAEQKYQEAEALLDSPDDKMQLARVLLSEGRLHRAHGDLTRAAELYERGLKMAEDTGDRQGCVQIMNALGVAYGEQRKFRESLVIFQRALDLSKEMNLAPMTEMLRQNVAESHINLGEYQRGIDILEEMNSRNPDPFPYSLQFRYSTLAGAYQELGEYDRALAAAAKSVAEAKAHKNEQLLSQPLMFKAHAEEKLGQNEAALADVRDALQVIERLRSRLVPTDFMKSGFAERTQEAFAYSVQLLDNLHEPGAALEVAEQARSRAFLDLLAARGIQDDTAVKSQETASAKSESNAASKNSTTGDSNATSTALTTRGTPAAVPRKPDPAKNLASPASVAPPSSDQMAAIAKRLDSTVLSYWVSSDATYIWTLKPDGTIREARSNVSQDRLTKLVTSTMALGEEPPTPSEKASQSVQASASPSTASPKPQAAVRLRGGGELVLGNSSRQAWRELYKLLILPVRDSLPPAGGRLTIVPYGPLFRLSFAALTDDRGRYLVEDYALNYTPALGLLQFTGARKNEIEGRTPEYLLLADPQVTPGLLKDVSLPPLPSARLEAESVARLFPAKSVSVLIASAATKAAVRTQAPEKTVLHFATHAIVRDDDPFASFLALTGDSAAGDDGRLSVQDIYGLSMPADLVVLSACRTALGKVSGDGMVGLTRAFFYAGAISVMATLWDVADDPTYLLISNFYKNLRKGQSKSAALRTAQLHLLRELRAGRLRVHTAAGSLTLPEDPVFWAGFVLQGEP